MLNIIPTGIEMTKEKEYATTTATFNEHIGESAPAPYAPIATPRDETSEYSDWRMVGSTGVMKGQHVILYWSWERDKLSKPEKILVVYVNFRTELGPLGLPGDPPTFLVQDTELRVGNKLDKRLFPRGTRVNVVREINAGLWHLKVWDPQTLNWRSIYSVGGKPEVTTDIPSDVVTGIPSWIDKVTEVTV